MTRSYRKNTLRTFKNTLSRFAAVFAIVALGVGFLAGLSGTPIDMKESMERYMDDADFYDLRVVSTLGLTDEDVAALGQVDGVRDSRATRPICWSRQTATPSSAAPTVCPRRTTTRSTVCALWTAACLQPPASAWSRPVPWS